MNINSLLNTSDSQSREIAVTSEECNQLCNKIEQLKEQLPSNMENIKNILPGAAQKIIESLSLYFQSHPRKSYSGTKNKVTHWSAKKNRSLPFTIELLPSKWGVGYVHLSCCSKKPDSKTKLVAEVSLLKKDRCNPVRLGFRFSNKISPRIDKQLDFHRIFQKSNHVVNLLGHYVILKPNALPKHVIFREFCFSYSSIGQMSVLNDCLQMLEALKEIHSKKIFYGAFCLDKLSVFNGRIKLEASNCYSKITDKSLNIDLALLENHSPEALKAILHKEGCTNIPAPDVLTLADFLAIDVWAFGCVMYKMCEGVDPPWFKKSDNIRTLDKKLNCLREEMNRLTGNDFQNKLDEINNVIEKLSSEYTAYQGIVDNEYKNLGKAANIDNIKDTILLFALNPNPRIRLSAQMLCKTLKEHLCSHK